MKFPALVPIQASIYMYLGAAESGGVSQQLVQLREGRPEVASPLAMERTPTHRGVQGAHVHVKLLFV